MITKTIEMLHIFLNEWTFFNLNHLLSRLFFNVNFVEKKTEKKFNF